MVLDKDLLEYVAHATEELVDHIYVHVKKYLLAQYDNGKISPEEHTREMAVARICHSYGVLFYRSVDGIMRLGVEVGVNVDSKVGSDMHCSEFVTLSILTPLDHQTQLMNYIRKKHPRYYESLVARQDSTTNDCNTYSIPISEAHH